ncbi:MAG TPA: hypothetical protein VLJ42_00620 [Solirubrobacteraceae bacterium]|nr:hypothetical protein [Solirubrobacteraceae bacterium]
MDDVNTGAAHTGIDTPTHVKGIKEGNARGNYEKMSGHKPDGTSTAARSTGVAVTDPIDPSMPNLSPA